MATDTIMATTEGETKRAAFTTDMEEFFKDERISLDKATNTFKLEDELGEEWEFNETALKWIPVTDEEDIKRQQEAYRVAELDEDEPAVDHKKRKAAELEEHKSKAKKQKAETPRQKVAVYVSSLPDNVTVDELKEVFSKYGVIAESPETGEPRIKVYTNADGTCKGDAMVVYFRPESVQLAIQMLDETDFRYGDQLVTGPMRVQEADDKYKAQKDQPLKSEEAKKKGTGAHKNREQVIKKNQELNSRLADWSDDEPQTIKQTSSRYDKVVVFKHLFTPAELIEDPDGVTDIKDLVREECEKHGVVTSVVVYDREEDGVVTARFTDAAAAADVAKVFDGRQFDFRTVRAYISGGNERFAKTKKNAGGEEEEQKRLENFSKFIEGKEA